MKRFAIIVVMTMLAAAAWARPIHYFTLQQATRTVSYLNAQQELMIYYGFDYEIPTYVLLNEVWMERVNSSYYELWIFGYDAYTGDEIIMPIELQGIWLFSAGHIYNAAQYLRFQTDARTPGFTWTIPPYHPYTRIHHRPGYSRSYHYDIHRHGWMPPAWTPGHSQPPLPHYYIRQPNTPAPMPTSTWTPGVNRPEVAAVEQTHDTSPTTGRQVQSSHTTGNGQRGTSRTSTTTSTRSTQSTAAGSTTPGRNTVRNSQSTEGRTSERTATSASTDRSSSRTATGSTTNRSSERTATNASTDRSSSRTATGSTTNRSSDRTTTNASTDRSSSRTATSSTTNRSSERKTNPSSTRTSTSTRTR
jgi:hypothetical protein